MITQFALANTGEFFSPERVSKAGIVTLEGMLAIFAVLALLWLAVEIMHLFFRQDTKKTKITKESDSEKKKQQESEAVAVPNEQDAAVAAAIAASLAAYEDGGATVAAIIAAISAARAEAGETGEFRVVSFKRTAGRRRRS